ncbi:NUDIX hydrolase [Nocardioides carbamazepini]|uniref:NUDIX hydrolase n=1 Tax=Nocardioides carbamazepini TaxID=2854259 RepID=UPI002353AD0E|nr:NUDIX domain-containing protein [Nocardioides carbamazepini]
MTEPWKTTVTAFALTRMDRLWLMIRHERLGVTSWELPGGHVDPGETLEEAAARETAEETGVAVEVGRLIASCVHEWHERRQRKLICFFEATAAEGSVPRVPPGEPQILEAAWVDPFVLDSASPFLVPLIEQQLNDRSDAPISFLMTHRINSDGLWEPAQVAPER